MNRRRQFLFLALGLASITAGLTLGNDLSAEAGQSALQADAVGWRDITPNIAFEGWKRSAFPAFAPLGVGQWEVDPKAGVLRCSGEGGHEWLRFDRELRDFILHVEWRRVPGETHAQSQEPCESGVFVRNSADGKVKHQAQIGEVGGYFLGQTLVKGTMRGFDFGGQRKRLRLNPPGEWNVYEVTCDGGGMALWANGETVSEWSGCEVRSGYLGLEADGGRIEFRNLKLKEL